MSVMSVPYLEGGRSRQKARTRDALLAAVRKLIARGITPTVEDAAEAAGISRTTAYRYFPNQRALLLGAHPEIERTTLLPPDAPEEVTARLDVVLDEHFRILLDWEPQLRTSLRLSLEPAATQPPLRGGRAISWIEDALTPLRATHPDLDTQSLAVAIRAVAGIEPYVWLRDIAGQAEEQALATMRGNAHAVLADALSGSRQQGVDSAAMGMRTANRAPP